MPDHYHRRRRSRPLAPVRAFLAAEAASGVVLVAATLLALVWASSPAADTYVRLWQHELTVGWGRAAIHESLQHWVNDGLMTVFFFVVGLEIHREMTTGELADRRAAAAPALAALGGMLAPAALYLLVVGSAPGATGWGIPMATDIAFAVSVLVLLGHRAPSGLRLFLLALAIVDDIGAVVVIAVFYAGGLSAAWLAVTLVALAAVVVQQRAPRLQHPLAYVPLAGAAWYGAYRSGVHPTLVGVALGLLTPAHEVRGRPVLSALEQRLHPISAFVVVPVFALANAGIDLRGSVVPDALQSRVTWAVIVGLVVGKPLGVAAATVVGVRARLARLPGDVDRRLVAGGGALAGIGFTVALFVASLAFDDPALEADAKIGILLGSGLAAATGSLVLVALSRRAARPARRARPGSG